MADQEAQSSSRRLAPILWGLLAIFILRVISQILVALGWTPWLPPMEEWYSGFISYPLLLCIQILLVIVMSKICFDLTRVKGFFSKPHGTFGEILRYFGGWYLAIMIIRYVLRMTLFPHERWTGGSIPIFFHWVLAFFLIILGNQYHVASKVKKEKKFMAAVFFRWIPSATIALGVCLWIFYQLAPTVLAHYLNFRPAEYAVRLSRGVQLTTSDGIHLSSYVFYPKGKTKAPTILIRIPWWHDVTFKLIADVIGRLWAERGYVVVLQSTRGWRPSGGTYVPFRYERQDGIDTLKWIAKQPWWNNELGMWGGSYFGYTQLVLGDQTNPGPSALFVQICSSDWYKMFYPGDALSLESALFWAVWSEEGLGKQPSIASLEPGFKGFPLIRADDRARHDIGFFNDWVSHSNRDDYWKQVDGATNINWLRSPTLFMAGWYDPFLPGMLADFTRVRRTAEEKVARKSRLIIGPWAHARPIHLPNGPRLRNYRIDSIQPSLNWFDEILSDRPSKISSPVRIFVLGKNVWRDEQEWPLARTRYVSYFLHSNGKANSADGDGALLLVNPDHSQLSDTYSYDPRDPVPSAGGAMFGPRGGIERQNDIEQRSDVLVYSTPPLEKDVEVTGPVKVILYVSTSAPNTDFTAKLVDVYPDGSAFNVCDGILRRSYQPSIEPTEIQFDLWPTSMVFSKRHRIRLEVSSSNYPRFDRNPNTGRNIGAETQPVKTAQTVYHRQGYQSRLILPIIGEK